MWKMWWLDKKDKVMWKIDKNDKFMWKIDKNGRVINVKDVVAEEEK